jgi:hypothetical protein
MLLVSVQGGFIQYVTPYCTVASLTGTSASFPISIHLHPVRSQKKRTTPSLAPIPSIHRLALATALQFHSFWHPFITRAPEELLRLC